MNGRAPVVPTHALCLDCKMAGYPCVMVAHGKPCLGPVTQTGCGALCPAVGRGCYGCFGPHESPNCPALSTALKEVGLDDQHICHAYRSFNAGAESFRRESEAHD